MAHLASFTTYARSSFSTHRPQAFRPPQQLCAAAAREHVVHAASGRLFARHRQASNPVRPLSIGLKAVQQGSEGNNGTYSSRDEVGATEKRSQDAKVPGAVSAEAAVRGLLRAAKEQKLLNDVEFDAVERHQQKLIDADYVSAELLQAATLRELVDLKVSAGAAKLLERAFPGQTGAKPLSVAARLQLLRTRPLGSQGRPMSLDEVEYLLQAGENSTVDFKQVIWNAPQKRFSMSQQAIAEAACAVANTATGGTLLFGVNDSRQVVGIDKDKLQEFSSHLTRALRDTANPRIEHVASNLQQQDAQWIVAVDIPPARAVTAAGGKVMKRVGDSTIQLTGTTLADFQTAMMSMVSIFGAGDGRPVPGADIDVFIEPGRLRRFNFVTKQGEIGFEDELMCLRLAALDPSGNKVLTVAGLLIAGIEDWQDRLADCGIFSIQIQRHNVDDPSVDDAKDPVADKQITGDTLRMVDQATNSIVDMSEELYEKRSLKDASGRLVVRGVRFQAFPEAAISELLMNAIVHRSYVNMAQRTVVHVYKRCLLIKSPGDLMPGLRASELETLGSMWRNRILAWNMSWAKGKRQFEGMGRGIKKARDLIEEAGGTLTITSDPMLGVTVKVTAAPSPRSTRSAAP